MSSSQLASSHAAAVPEVVAGLTRSGNAGLPRGTVVQYTATELLSGSEVRSYFSSGRTAALNGATLVVKASHTTSLSTSA